MSQTKPKNASQSKPKSQQLSTKVTSIGQTTLPKTNASQKTLKSDNLKLPPKKTHHDEDDEECPDDASTTTNMDKADREDIDVYLREASPIHVYVREASPIHTHKSKSSKIVPEGSIKKHDAPTNDFAPISHATHVVTDVMTPAHIQQELSPPSLDPIPPTNTTSEVIQYISQEMSQLLKETHKKQSEIILACFTTSPVTDCIMKGPHINYEKFQIKTALTKSEKALIQQRIEKEILALEYINQHLEILNATTVTNGAVTIDGHTLKLSDMTSDQQSRILSINREKSKIRPDNHIEHIKQYNDLLNQFRDIPDAPECNSAIKEAFAEWKASFNNGKSLTEKWIDIHKHRTFTLKYLEQMVEESISYQKSRLKITQNLESEIAKDSTPSQELAHIQTSLTTKPLQLELSNMRELVIELISVYANAPDEESSKQQLLIMYSTLNFVINEGPESELLVRTEKFLGIPNLINFFTKQFLGDSVINDDTTPENLIELATKLLTAVDLPFAEEEWTLCAGEAPDQPVEE